MEPICALHESNKNVLEKKHNLLLYLGEFNVACFPMEPNNPFFFLCSWNCPSLNSLHIDSNTVVIVDSDNT